MKVNRKWLILGGVVLGAGALLAAGVPLGTLVLALAFLACPLSMMLGMRMACQMGSRQPQASARADAGPGVPNASQEREPVGAGKDQRRA